MRPLGSAEQQWVVVQASYMADQGVLIEANKSSIANPPKQPVVELVRLSMQHLSFSLALHTRIVVDRIDGSSTPHGASLALHIGHFLRYAAAAGQAAATIAHFNHSLTHALSAGLSKRAPMSLRRCGRHAAAVRTEWISTCTGRARAARWCRCTRSMARWHRCCRAPCT